MGRHGGVGVRTVAVLLWANSKNCSSPCQGELPVPFRLPFSFPVRRRGGRFNDAGIHNPPFLAHQPFFCQMLLDALKQHLGQPMTLQQVAEVRNRRLLRYLSSD